MITDVELRGLIGASCLSSIQRSTLLMMADGLYRHDLRIRIGFQRLADLLGLGRRATIDRVRSLETTGVIRLERSGGGRNEAGKGITNVWVLDLDTLRLQTLARTLESEVNVTEPDTTKGAVNCEVYSAADNTDNGAEKPQHGCSPATPRVQPTAHDPVSPQPPKEETNHDQTDQSSQESDVNIHRRRTCPKEVLPWVNRYAGPEQTKADRLEQLRAQVNQVEKSARTQP